MSLIQRMRIFKNMGDDDNYDLMCDFVYLIINRINKYKEKGLIDDDTSQKIIQFEESILKGYRTNSGLNKPVQIKATSEVGRY